MCVCGSEEEEGDDDDDEDEEKVCGSPVYRIGRSEWRREEEMKGTYIH